MKKMLAFATMALMVVAAQALTTTWTKVDVESGDKVTLANYLGANYKGSFSVAIIFNLSTLPTTQTGNNIFWIGSSSTGANVGIGTGKQTIDSVEHYKPWGNNGADWTSNAQTSDFVLGENIAGLTVNRDASNPANFTVSYYGNGVMATGQQSWTNKGTTVYDEVTIGALIESGAELYIIGEVATAADFAALPEPTCLALLALGVAGIALKRKVA